VNGRHQTEKGGAKGWRAKDFEKEGLKKEKGKSMVKGEQNDGVDCTQGQESKRN